MPRVLVVIPARSGSTRVQHKNVRPLQKGRSLSLLSLTAITAAAIGQHLGDTCTTSVVLSTDAPEYLQHVAEDSGIRLINRPADLSGPTADIADATAHALETCEGMDDVNYDWVITLQPAVPLRTAAICARMLHDAIRLHCVAAITGVRTVPWLWGFRNGEAVNSWTPDPYPRSQEQPQIKWQELNSVQLARRDVVKRRQRWDLPMLVQFLPPWAVLDIDTPEDFQRAGTVLLPLLDLLRQDNDDGALVVSRINGVHTMPVTEVA